MHEASRARLGLRLPLAGLLSFWLPTNVTPVLGCKELKNVIPRIVRKLLDCVLTMGHYLEGVHFNTWEASLEPSISLNSLPAMLLSVLFLVLHIDSCTQDIKSLDTAFMNKWRY